MLYYWAKCLIFKELLYTHELNELSGKPNKLLGGCSMLRSFLGAVFVLLGKTLYFQRASSHPGVWIVREV